MAKLHTSSKLGDTKKKIDITLICLMYIHNSQMVSTSRIKYVERDGFHLYQEDKYKMHMSIKNIGRVHKNGLSLDGVDEVMNGYYIYCYEDEASLNSAKYKLMLSITEKLDKLKNLTKKVNKTISSLRKVKI